MWPSPFAHKVWQTFMKAEDPIYVLDYNIDRLQVVYEQPARQAADAGLRARD